MRQLCVYSGCSFRLTLPISTTQRRRFPSSIIIASRATMTANAVCQVEQGTERIQRGLSGRAKVD